MTTKKFVNCKERIDHQTGETIVTEMNYIKKVDSDNFIMVYLSDMSSLFSIKGEIEQFILTWMWANTGWNNSPVAIDKFIKEDLSSTHGVKPQSISDALTRLVAKGLIIKNRRLFYSLNPKYFFKGDKKEREQMLRVNVDYHIENKSCSF